MFLKNFKHKLKIDLNKKGPYKNFSDCKKYLYPSTCSGDIQQVMAMMSIETTIKTKREV